MSGIDRQRFVSLTDDDYEEIKCGVCLGVLNKPLVTQCCQQSYCTVCITEWIRNSKTCPNCRKSVTAKKLFPAPRFSVNLIEKLDIYCDFRDNGCQHISKLSVLDQHLTNCPFSPDNKCEFCHEFRAVGDSDHKCGLKLKELVDSLRLEVKELKKSNEKLRSVSRKHKSKLIESEKRLTDELKAKSDECETLLMTNTLFEQQISALTHELTESKQRIRCLSEQNQSFSIENLKFKTELKELRKHCEDFLNKKEVYEKSVDTLTQELDKSKLELNLSKEQSDQQLIELNALRRENEELKKHQFFNEQHMSEVIQSARDHIRKPDINRSKLSKIQQNFVLNKMIESIEKFETFKDIAENVRKDIECHKRGIFWNTIVYSNSCCHSINYTNEDIIDVCFGKLRLKLISV